MLNIYAQSMLTATRSPCVRLHDVPATGKTGKRRWFSGRRTICVELDKL